jgi:hypothetical protein
MAGPSRHTSQGTFTSLGPTGLGTSAARLGARLGEAAPPAEPPSSLPSQPFAGPLVALLSEAMVETAALVDNEAGKIGRLSQTDPLRLRRLRYPFPSRISPHAQAAEAHSMDWAVSHDFLAGPAEIDRFERSHIGIFAGRTHPEATPVGLNWIADLGVWLFAFDDRFCDESSFGLHPGKLARQVVPLLRVLDCPSAPVVDGSSFAAALADLRDRFGGFGSPQQWARFASAVRAYLLGNIWEAAHREAGEHPSVADYTLMRAHAGATPTVFAVLDAVCGYEVPDTPLVRSGRGQARQHGREPRRLLQRPVLLWPGVHVSGEQRGPQPRCRHRQRAPLQPAGGPRRGPPHAPAGAPRLLRDARARTST